MHGIRWYYIVAAACLALPGASGESLAQGMMGQGMGPGMMGGGMGPGMMGAYGQQPGREGQAPGELDTPQGRAYASACAQCHALPDPRQHDARQWPAVVARMETYMRNAHVGVPDPGTIKEIESFLESHARG
ncbi:MAG TPA: hypothetical protein VEG27_10365 [Usitatibacter sp.]|nr:hypothetical protein [Usitatibacter sp.]